MANQTSASQDGIAPPPQTTPTSQMLGTPDSSGMSTGSGTPNAPASTTAGMGAPNAAPVIDPNQFNGKTAAQGSAVGYTGAGANLNNWDVNGNQTVAGQVKGIIDSNSPLMQQAVQKANEASNGKGLLNSSMAVTSGQSALYGAAMPIAQQDAQTYANAAHANADAANQNSQFNANATNASNAFNATQTNAMTSQNTAATNDMTKTVMADSLQAQVANQSTGLQQSAQAYDAAVKGAMQGADNATKVALANLDSSTRTQLMQMQSQYNVQMQTSNSMASTYQSLVSNITAIMQDQNLDAGAKQSAISNLTSMYNNALQMQSSISGLNLGSLLSPQAMGAPTSGGAGGAGDPNANIGTPQQGGTDQAGGQWEGA